MRSTVVPCKYLRFTQPVWPTDHNAQGGSQIQWGACDPSVVNDTSLSCGFLLVPLDYQDPSVGTARLAIVKANATGERRGSLFFNPGQLPQFLSTRKSLTPQHRRWTWRLRDWIRQ